MRSASALVLGPSFSGHGLWRHKGPVRPGLCVFPPRFSGWGVLNAGAPPRMEFVVTRSAALGLAAVLLVPPLAAQLPAADEAFRKGDYAAARAGYERVLTTDSLNARALAVAWGGDLDRAEQLWRAALTRHPDDAELLIGLAQTLYWKGQPGLAEAYAARARALAPEDRVARDLERAVRAALRPEAGTKVDGANDSDHNRFVAQEATVATSLGPDVRGTLQAGWRRATGPVPGDTVRRSGTSYGAGGYVIAALGHGAVVRAGLGVRRVEPEASPAHTPLTAQLGVGLGPGRYAAVNVAYSRTPFDETAGLMRLDLVVDAVDLALDVSPGPGWSISAGGGGAWLSDSNSRYSAVGAVLGRVVRGLQIGPFARIFGYRESRVGLYFAPIRFSTIEGRAVYQWQRSRWGVRADGGLGSQRLVLVGVAPQTQTEWHVGLSLSRGWGANNELTLVGSITNSAAATTTVGVPGASFRRGRDSRPRPRRTNSLPRRCSRSSAAPSRSHGPRGPRDRRRISIAAR